MADLSIWLDAPPWAQHVLDLVRDMRWLSEEDVRWIYRLAIHLRAESARGFEDDLIAHWREQADG